MKRRVSAPASCSSGAIKQKTQTILYNLPPKNLQMHHSRHFYIKPIALLPTKKKIFKKKNRQNTEMWPVFSSTKPVCPESAVWLRLMDGLCIALT